jgi:8-amino-7-oxononanoate synthase
LMQKARPYIYTTALPQPVASATRKALEVAEREPWRRERVLALTARFRAQAEKLGVPLMRNLPLTPIQPIVMGDAETVLRAQQELLSAGFCVVAIRPPTVPNGSSRLRVTLSAAHSESQVDRLADTLGRICAMRPTSA